MTAVDNNRVLGNFGSAWVAQALSRHCLVRPVADGTDIGLDLYCETLAEGPSEPEGDSGTKPAPRAGFLHFWVQVKAGAQVELQENGQASCSFEVEHLQ